MPSIMIRHHQRRKQHFHSFLTHVVVFLTLLLAVVFLPCVMSVDTTTTTTKKVAKVPKIPTTPKKAVQPYHQPKTNVAAPPLLRQQGRQGGGKGINLQQGRQGYVGKGFNGYYGKPTPRPVPNPTLVPRPVPTDRPLPVPTPVPVSVPTPVPTPVLTTVPTPVRVPVPVPVPTPRSPSRSKRSKSKKGKGKESSYNKVSSKSMKKGKSYYDPSPKSSTPPPTLNPVPPPTLNPVPPPTLNPAPPPTLNPTLTPTPKPPCDDSPSCTGDNCCHCDPDPFCFDNRPRSTGGPVPVVPVREIELLPLLPLPCCPCDPDPQCYQYQYQYPGLITASVALAPPAPEQLPPPINCCYGPPPVSPPCYNCDIFGAPFPGANCCQCLADKNCPFGSFGQKCCLVPDCRDCSSSYPAGGPGGPLVGQLVDIPPCCSCDDSPSCTGDNCCFRPEPPPCYNCPSGAPFPGANCCNCSPPNQNCPFGSSGLSCCLRANCLDCSSSYPAGSGDDQLADIIREGDVLRNHIPVPCCCKIICEEVGSCSLICPPSPVDPGPEPPTNAPTTTRITYPPTFFPTVTFPPSSTFKPTTTFQPSVTPEPTSPA